MNCYHTPAGFNPVTDAELRADPDLARRSVKARIATLPERTAAMLTWARDHGADVPSTLDQFTRDDVLALYDWYTHAVAEHVIDGGDQEIIDMMPLAIDVGLAISAVLRRMSGNRLQFHVPHGPKSQCFGHVALKGWPDTPDWPTQSKELHLSVEENLNDQILWQQHNRAEVDASERRRIELFLDDACQLGSNADQSE